jgi:hypothetical protein
MTSPLTEQQLADIQTRVNAATVCPDAEVNGRRDGQHTWTGSLTHLRCELCGFTRPRGERAEETALLLAEIRRLRAELARQERLHGDTIDDRDRAQDAADKLAYAVASEDVIGEHTADNSPWANALDLVTPKATVDKLRADLTAVRSQTVDWAAGVVDAKLTAEPDHNRASALYEVLLHLRGELPCTCARSQGLHEKTCRKYVPGHELLSPVLALAAYRAERPAAVPSV